jgi:pimeloyl-ACP methyl ester carboxylesterase
VMGFCIGGPFIWNLLQRAPERIVAAVLVQPSGFRPEMPNLSYQNNMKGWGPVLCERRPDITMEMVDAFLTNMYGLLTAFEKMDIQSVYEESRLRAACL